MLRSKTLTPALLLLKLHFKFLFEVFYTLKCIFALMFYEGLFLLLLLYLFLGDLLLDDSTRAWVLSGQVVLDLIHNCIRVSFFTLLEADLILQLFNLLISKAFSSLSQHLIVHFHSINVEPSHFYLYEAPCDVHAAVWPEAYLVRSSLSIRRLLQDRSKVLIYALDHFNFFSLALPETEWDLILVCRSFLLTYVSQHIVSIRKGFMLSWWLLEVLAGAIVLVVLTGLHCWYGFIRRTLPRTYTKTDELVSS